MTPVRRLTILAPHFYPETNAAGRRLTSAAAHFRDAGWQVTIITPAPHHPENVVREGYGGAWRRVSIEDGMKVIRFAPFLVSPGSLPLRLLSELLFATKAMAQALFTKPNAVLSSSPYMFLGPAGLMAARLTRSSFAWDVRDLTWKYVKATGRRTFGVDRLLDSLMTFTARRSDVLTAATDGILVELAEQDKAGRAVITNGLTPEFIEQLRSGTPALADDRFTVVYAGLLGFPQGLSNFITAAGLMPEARFILAGGGPEGGRLEKMAQELGLTNVDFLGHLDTAQLLDLYASADVLVAMLRGSEAFKVAQPSKVWEYMATGQPVVFAGDCEATRIMEDEDIGVVVPPEDPAALAEALERLAGDSVERTRLGQRGRAFVMAERNRDQILQKWERLLDAEV